MLKSSSRDFEGIGDMVLRLDGGSWIVQGTDPQTYAAEKAYRESGIVRSILALMDEQPEWQGIPTQLLDAVMAIYHGQLETYNPSKLGTELEHIMGQLYERDGIVIMRKKVNGRRVLSTGKGLLTCCDFSLRGFAVTLVTHVTLGPLWGDEGDSRRISVV